MAAVPEDLIEAVHRAAQATPPHAADLANVHRRRRARRRRRAAATAGGLAALVALTGGALPMLADARSAPTPATPSRTSAAPATSPPATPVVPAAVPAQRLVIDVAGETWRGDNGTGPVAGHPGVAAVEVLPDGTVRRHRVPDGWEQTVASADGRLIGLQLTDLRPGVHRRDGPDVEGLSVKLVVLGPDDSVQTAREIRVRGAGVELLGTDGTVAYLARDGGLVAHDLATGREEMLLRSSTAGVDLLAASRTDLKPDHLVEQRTDDGCHTDVRRLTDGKRIARLTLDGLCENGLRLSPNGRLVAVPYQRLPDRVGDREQRLAVFDVATGTLRTDRLVGTSHRASAAGRIQGVAWADETTVRVAWTDRPEGARLDSVDVVTVAVR
ncbi:hypothetical protein [Micromonospora echinaurantiaca]|uniref:hypothetical protein n=1 Tax=Micromonospora echinaurantiaca TaxID=47857 RepID=UPI00378EA65A